MADVSAKEEVLNNPDDPRHGTLSAYRNYGCRCDPCKAANAAYQAGARAARYAGPTPRGVHGTNRGYLEYGCRKKCCREAHRIANGGMPMTA